MVSVFEGHCKAPNYFHDRNIICTYKDIVKQTQGGIFYVVIFSPDHVEHPDQEFKSWHCIKGIAEDNIPKIIIVHASGYDTMFICPMVD
jgi:hypothetical protein